MKAFLIGFSFVAIALLSGCQQQTVQGPMTVYVPVYDAEGPTWVLYHLNGHPVAVAPTSAGLRLYPSLTRVYATSGLNQFSAGYRIDYGSLKFQPFTMDTKLVGTPAQMELEQEIIATLGRVTSWRMQEKILVLLEGTNPVAYFVSHQAPTSPPPKTEAPSK